jgi:hypothetical protein
MMLASGGCSMIPVTNDTRTPQKVAPTIDFTVNKVEANAKPPFCGVKPFLQGYRR